MFQSTAPTVHTRVTGERPALDGHAALFGRAERKLHAAFKAGREWRGDLQTSFYRPLGLSSAHLDHVRKGLLGKLDGIRELMLDQAQQMQAKAEAKRRQVAKAEKGLAKAKATIARHLAKRDALQEQAGDIVPKLQDRKSTVASKARTSLLKVLNKLKAADVAIDKSRKERNLARFRIHQHKRRLAILEHRAAEMAARAKEPSLAFGSRDLFRKQFHLAANGYAGHEEWLVNWRAARVSQFYVEGNAAYEGGNQFVRLTANEAGTFDLELRLPPGLTQYAETCEKVKGRIIHSIHLRGLRFAHGAEQLRAWLVAHKDGKGRPISYRFVKDATSWRVFVTCLVDHAVLFKGHDKGALGVDYNLDHVAVTQADRYGNPVATWRLALDVRGMSSGQALNAARQVVAKIAKLAVELRLPVVAEKLDFRAKKAALTQEHGARYARMLSGLAYSAFGKALYSAAARNGVYLRLVNPAYTSLIGRVKFARRYGLSVHAAAALSIARRAMELSERLPAPVEQPDDEGNPVPVIVVPLDGGDHVTLAPPARMGRRHVWSRWRQLARGRSAALAARARERRQTLSATVNPGASLTADGEGTGRTHRASGGEIPPAKREPRPPPRLAAAQAASGTLQPAVALSNPV